MPKLLKMGLIALAGFAILFASLLVIIAWTVDPNSYKAQIVQLVQDNKQRTLTLEGDIKLKLFPRIGLDLGKTQLSEHQGKALFAALDSVKLYVAWLPLLRKELVVTKISLDGLQANLLRRADGTTNFDDLMSKSESPAIKFDIRGVDVTRSGLRFEDKQAQRVLTIKDLDLHSGRIKEDIHSDIDLSMTVSSDHPQLNAKVALKSGVLFALAAQHYAFDNLKAQLDGEALGLQQLALKTQGDIDVNFSVTAFAFKDVKAALTGQQGADKFRLALAAPQLKIDSLQASGKQVTLEADREGTNPLSVQLTLPEINSRQGQFQIAPLTLAVKGKQGARDINGKLSSPVSGNFKAKTFSLDKLVGDLSMSGAQAKPLHMQFNGAVTADLLAQKVSTLLSSRLDETTMRAQIGMQNFTQPHWQFDIDIDQINLDKYVGTASSAGKSSSGKSVEQPMDFSALRSLNANGQISIGQLTFSNVKSSNVRLEFKAANGRVAADSVSANLYQGSLQGSAAVTASANPQFVLQQNLKGVNVGPLLRDFTRHDVLEGRGNLTMQVNAQGGTTRAMTQILRGNAALSLQNGEIKGVNLASILRKAESALQVQAGGFAQMANANEKTTFSAMQASFQIRDGIAHNDDLLVTSSLMRTTGKGDIDLNRASLDYLAKGTLTGAPGGQLGKYASQLKGLTIPVKVAGSFDALHYSVDAGELLADTAKAQLDQQKDLLRQKAQDKLREQLPAQLKGLFGR